MNLADKVQTHSNLTDTTIKKVNTDFIVIPDIIIKILNISELLDGAMKKRIWANDNDFLQKTAHYIYNCSNKYNQYLNNRYMQTRMNDWKSVKQ